MKQQQNNNQQETGAIKKTIDELCIPNGICIGNQNTKTMPVKTKAMKKNNQQTTPQPKKYVPYGMNGEYFVYDNEAGQIPMGYGSKQGTKKKIQTICDELNETPQPSNTEGHEGKPDYFKNEYAASLIEGAKGIALRQAWAANEALTKDNEALKEQNKKDISAWAEMILDLDCRAKENELLKEQFYRAIDEAAKCEREQLKKIESLQEANRELLEALNGLINYFPATTYTESTKAMQNAKAAISKHSKI